MLKFDILFVKYHVTSLNASLIPIGVLATPITHWGTPDKPQHSRGFYDKGIKFENDAPERGLHNRRSHDSRALSSDHMLHFSSSDHMLIVHSIIYFDLIFLFPVTMYMNDQPCTHLFIIF